MDIFNIFIHFPTKDIENEINTRENLEFYFDKIQISIDRADCEKGTRLFYSESNIIDFFKEIKLISEIENYDFLSFETYLYSNCLTNADNWEDKQHFDNSHDTKYCLWNFYENEICSDFPIVLKEITEQKLLNKEEKYLLLNFNRAFDYNRKFIPIFKDNLKNTTQHLPQFIHIYFVTDFFELEKWFKENRIRRNYNFEDNRHIKSSNAENSTTKKGNKSPILGNDKHHIANLLDDAIGDTNHKNYLINFDETHNQYVRYEYENKNPQNQYHGYHLVLQETYERDEKEVNKIPEKIKQILNYRKNKNKE